MALRIEHGPFTALFEPEIGFLRYLRYGGRELVRAVYAVVREPDWGTLRHEPVSLEQDERGVRWTHRLLSGDDLWAELEGQITLEPTRVRYRATIRPLKTFSTARTGLCLLHPREQAGEPATIVHPSGAEETSAFPDLVLPDQPFYEVQGMHLNLDELRLGIRFSGEVFETEDQRNWMDASYKTYCRPQDRPKPYELTEDDLVEHTVDLSVTGPEEPPIWPDAGVAEEERGSGKMPRLGAVVASAPLEDVEAVRALGLSFVALVLEGDPASALANAQSLGLPVTLIAHRPWEDGWRELAGGLDVTTVHLDHRVPGLLDAVDRVRAAFPGARVLAAARDNFVDINRDRPAPGTVDGIAFPGNPQVHAFDELSIRETPSTLPDQIRTAQSFGGPYVEVGPLTLEGREEEPDERRATELASRWALSALGHAGLAGAEAVILFETHGPKGLLGTPVAEVVRGLAGTAGEPFTFTDDGLPAPLFGRIEVPSRGVKVSA